MKLDPRQDYEAKILGHCHMKMAKLKIKMKTTIVNEVFDLFQSTATRQSDKMKHTQVDVAPGLMASYRERHFYSRAT